MSTTVIADIILQGMPGARRGMEPQITALDGGGFVVTWTGGSFAANLREQSYDIFVQSFDADGIMLSGLVRLRGVPEEAHYWDGDPQITALDDGGFVVAWSGGTASQHSDVFVQRFDADGAVLGAAVQLGGVGDYRWDRYPRITALDDGGFVVTWTGYTGSEQYDDIFVQRFDADGAVLGAAVQLRGVGGYRRDVQPQITALDDGGFVVTWSGQTSTNGTFDIFVQRFDAGGAKVGAKARLEGMEGNLSDGSAQITALDGGGFAVTWLGETSDGQGTDIFVQSFDAEGIRLSGLVRLQGMPGNRGDYSPQIAALDGGGFVITWTGGTGVLVQRFDADGVTLGSPVRLQGGAPQITALDDGGFVITWVGYTSDGQDADIFVQSFDAGGVMLGGPVHLQGMPGWLQDGAPQITALDGGGFVVTWSGRTFDGQSSDIFVQRFDADGNPISQNYAPIGEVSIRGVAEPGRVLRADTTTIADADGLGSFSYQWFADGVAIPGATGATYTPGLAQGGKAITVQVSYTDRQGTQESVISVSPAVVELGVSVESAETFVLPDNGRTTNLTLLGGADIDGTGNSLDNLLVGNWGNNGLFGGAGHDTLQGGAGNDTLNGEYGNDQLYGGAGNDTLNGEYGNDQLYGGAGNDLLFGAAGQDVLRGEAGSDTLRGGGLRDQLYGGAQDDLVQGDGGNDALFGNGGADTLYGGVGNDRLVGGKGKDVLYGGEGADQFVFRSAAEAGGGGGRDVIADFEIGADKINLRAMQDGLTFIGQAAFSGQAGEIRYNRGTRLVQGDLDGDGVADFAIEVTGKLALIAADFIL